MARAMLLAAVLFLATSGQAFAQRGVTASFLPDAAASLTVEDAASPAKAGEYQVYVPSFMAFSRIPGDFNGALWLRLALGPAFEKPVGALRVNFGLGLPGVTRLYIPAPGGFTAMESAPHEGVFTLPENAPFPDTLYARFDGVPGLWFRPVLEAAPENGSGPAPHVVLCGVFGAAMLLLLIQYLRKAGEWRLWAAITAGCGVVAALIPPAPAAGAAFSPLMAVGLLMPGLVLVFFAHAGRHLFDSPHTMPGYDKLLGACYILGGLIALWPLVPGNLQAARCLPLAGVALVFLLPAALAAMARSLKGGAGFFCAALLPVAGAAASAWQLTASGAPLPGGLGGLAGLALGMLVLGFTGPAGTGGEKHAEDDVFASLDMAWPNAGTEREETPAAGENFPPDPQEEPAAPESALELATEDIPAAEEIPPPTDTPGEAAPITLVDEDPLPVETTESAALPPQAAFTPAPSSSPAQDADPRIFDLHLLVKEAYDAAAALGEAKNIGMSWFVSPQAGRLFEGRADLLDSALRLLLRGMVDAVDRGNVRLTVRRLPDSRDAGHLVFTIVEWDARSTRHARSMAGLTEAWTLAEKTGGVFSVDHSPSSGTTVTFSSVFTPMDKPAPAENAEKTAPAASAPVTAVFAEPEEAPAPQAPDVPLFAGRPDIAASEDIAVTAIPVPPVPDAGALPKDGETGRDPARIIIVDTAASGRARTAAAFKDSPYSVLECASPPAAGALYARHPSALVLMDADMPEADIAAAIRDIHAGDARHGRSPAPVAALAGYEAQAGRMTRAGCARAVVKPLDRESLLALAGELAPLPGSAPAVTPSASETGETPQEPVPSPETMLHAALADIPPVAPPALSQDREREPEKNAEPVPGLPEDGGIFASVLPAEEPEEAPGAPESAEKRPAGSGLGLLDMIVTDEEGESVPVPGEEDSVFRDMLPLLPGLLCEFDDAMLDAARGREEKSPLLVQQAAERVAGKAENFGLTKLERMARCVERAAAADDIEPMECVLADLEAWIARYKEALNKLHREHQW